MVRSDGRENVPMVLMGMFGPIKKPLQTPPMESALDRQILDVQGLEDGNYSGS